LDGNGSFKNIDIPECAGDGVTETLQPAAASITAIVERLRR